MLGVWQSAAGDKAGQVIWQGRGAVTQGRCPATGASRALKGSVYHS